jgi:GT2 family glycosyltransferase
MLRNVRSETGANRTDELNLSIVIVSWNAKRHLLSCLDSLQKGLAGLEYEIIVVDNNSADGSVPAVRSSYPAVRLHCNHDNLGFAAANNIGIGLSTGRYVCLVNSDVVVLAGCFDALLECMARCTSAGLVGPKLYNADRTLQRSYGRFPTFGSALLEACFLYPLTGFGTLLKTRQVDFIAGSFMLIRREVLEVGGLFDETFFFYSEDVDFCRRLTRSGWSIYYIPKAQAVHYGGASTSNAPTSFYVQQVLARLQYWWKHHDQRAFRPYVLVLMFHQAIRIIVNSVMSAVLPTHRESTAARANRSTAALLFLSSVFVLGHRTISSGVRGLKEAADEQR